MSICSQLASLKQAISRTSPEPVKQFRPGITEAELDRLEASLPLLLPQGVRELYLSHDGATGEAGLLPVYLFLSFEEAIAEYKLEFELPGDLGSEGWNPIWFPLFSFQGDHCCVLLGEQRQQDSPVFVSFNDDTEIRMMFSSLAVLLDVSTRCFETGAYFLQDSWLQCDIDAVDAIRSKFGSDAPLEHVDGVNSYSKHFTQNWPEPWKTAIGRTEQDYQCLGADNSVANFIKRPEESRLHVRIVGLQGSGSASRLKVADDSGEMTVFCPGNATGSRETQIRRNYEMTVVPNNSGDDYAQGCAGLVTHMILRDRIKTEPPLTPESWVYVPAPDYESVVTISAGETVKAGDWLTLRATRKSGPWQRVKYATIDRGSAWYRHEPPEVEAEVAANLFWVTDPPKAGVFDVPTPTSLNLRERRVKFHTPGTYKIWATSATPTSSTSNSISIQVETSGKGPNTPTRD